MRRLLLLTCFYGCYAYLAMHRRVPCIGKIQSMRTAMRTDLLYSGVDRYGVDHYGVCIEII